MPYNDFALAEEVTLKGQAQRRPDPVTGKCIKDLATIVDRSGGESLQPLKY